MTNLKIADLFKIVFVLLIPIFSFGESAKYNCRCLDNGRGSYFADCAHTSSREYFDDSSSCHDYVSKLNRTDFTRENCQCANTALWCGGRIEGTFQTDRDCTSYMNNILQSRK